MERLAALTTLLGNRDKSPVNEEAQQLMKIYNRRPQQPHSQRNIYCKMKEEITSQKKLLKGKKKII